MDSGMDVDEASAIYLTTEDSDIDLTTEDSDIDLTTEDSDIDLTTEDSDMDDYEDSEVVIDLTGGSLTRLTRDSPINHTGDCVIDLAGYSVIDLPGYSVIHIPGGSLIRLIRDSVIHLTEDSDMDAITGGSVVHPTGSCTIPINRDAVIHLKWGSVVDFAGYSVLDLIRGSDRIGLNDIFNFFPNYQPMFREAPYLNPVLPFVCQDTCFLRNWLFVQHKLFWRFWADLLKQSGRDLPFSDADVRSTLMEMSGFFAFATIPFITQRLSNNNIIGKVGRLLRPSSDTLELVWRFYEKPLLVEMGGALGDGPIGTEPSAHSIGALQRVKAVFLRHQLEANKDFVPIDASVNETVCFNTKKRNHAREVERYWQAKLKDELFEKLQKLGPWTGCDDEESGRQRRESPEIYDTEPKIDFPRIRSPSRDEEAPSLSRSWLKVANTLHDHSQGCSKLFRHFSREEPEPPRQSMATGGCSW